MDGQNNQLAQILVPLAVAAGSAYSPYVARGVGPGLAALGAMGGFGNQKARNDYYQSQAELEKARLADYQQNKAAEAQLGQQLTTQLNQGTPIPGTQAAAERGYGPQGGSLSDLLGQPTQNQPLPVQEYPAGALVANPAEAAGIRNKITVDPRAALTAVDQLRAQQQLTPTKEALAREPIPNVRQSIKTREGETVQIEPKPEPETPKTPEIRNAFDLWLRDHPNGTYEQFKKDTAPPKEPKEVKPWEPTAAQMSHAQHVADKAATTTDELTGEAKYDRDLAEQVYEQEIEKVRPGRKAAPAPAPAPKGIQFVTSDGKKGWDGTKWVDLKK